MDSELPNRKRKKKKRTSVIIIGKEVVVLSHVHSAGPECRGGLPTPAPFSLRAGAFWRCFVCQGSRGRKQAVCVHVRHSHGFWRRYFSQAATGLCFTTSSRLRKSLKEWQIFESWYLFVTNPPGMMMDVGAPGDRSCCCAQHVTHVSGMFFLYPSRYLNFFFSSFFLVCNSL